MSDKNDLNITDLALEDRQLERLATEFPRCTTVAPDVKPQRCDAKTCQSARACEFAIRESLHVCKIAAKNHFNKEQKVLESIGDSDHQAKHQFAHEQLLNRIDVVIKSYEPNADRLATINAIAGWGDELHEHMRTLDVKMRALWTKRGTSS